MGHPGRDRTLIFFVTIACAYLVKWSVMTKMLCCPPLEGSKVTKVHINLSTD
jgi:hypothetical protein